MIMPVVNISEMLKRKALEIGFDLVGIAPISATRDLEFSCQWVEAGYGGEMRYLANPKRDDPRLILPSVQSVVCLGLVYNTPLAYSIECRKIEGGKQKVEGREQHPMEELGGEKRSEEHTSELQS